MMKHLTRRRHFLFEIGLATLAALLATPLQGEEAPASAQGDSVKVLSCNVRGPQPEDEKSGDGWEARRELCGDVIVSQNTDVICLQECRGYQLEELQKRLPEFDVSGLSQPVAEFTPNNAIMYSRQRFELRGSGGFWLSETPHVAGSKSWDSAVARSVNWVRLRDRQSGGEFIVWNTHFDHKGHVAREEQAKLVVAATAAFDAAGLPQILTGDMNANASHPAIAALKTGGWNDTIEALHGLADPGYTYHGFKGRERKSEAGRRIDWIFTRGDLRTLAAGVIRDGKAGRYPSDHYFMSATLQLGAE